MRVSQKRMTARQIERLIQSGGESNTHDYKINLSLDTTKENYEFLKAVAAFSNAAGGYIVIGVTDSGEPCGLKSNLDLADIHNVVEAFFGRPFDIEYSEHILNDGKIYGLIYIPSVLDEVIVMPKDGNYLDGKKTKAVFLQGDVYFRRGSRSIKACSTDYDFIFRKYTSHQPSAALEPQITRGNSNRNKRREVNTLCKYWNKLSNGSSDLTSTGQASINQFLESLTIDDLKRAMDVAYAKKV